MSRFCLVFEWGLLSLAVSRSCTMRGRFRKTCCCHDSKNRRARASYLHSPAESSVLLRWEEQWSEWRLRIKKQQTSLNTEHASDWEWASIKAGESSWALQWDHLCDEESHLSCIYGWISFCVPLKRIPSGQGSFSEPSHIKWEKKNTGYSGTS